MSQEIELYNEFRLEQQFCDVVIIVDNVEFPAHKIVLSNCSSYFRSLFTHWSTPDRRVFEIHKVAPDMMKIIIEFAYTGCVSVTNENVQDIFEAAAHFRVMGILKSCSNFLLEQLDRVNCIGIYMFTDIHYPEMKHKAFLYILAHFEEVAATSEEFLQLPAQEIVKFIEDDQLNVKEEKSVFEAILRWINHIPEERKKHLPLLLSKVRLALMSLSYIKEVVNENELVKANKECCPIIFKAMRSLADPRRNRLPGAVICPPLARPRLPNSILLAIGGWSGDGPINGIEAYDVRADSWVAVAHNDHNDAPRAYHGCAVLNGSIYCVGGFDSIEQLSSVHKFDLATHIWHEVAPMHSRRCYVSVTVMDGCIYAIGGYDGHDRLQTAERYDPITNQWTLIAPMHERRSDANCTAYDGKVYICGGFNGEEPLSLAECYNPVTNQWTMISPMSSRRSGIGVTTYAGHVYALGGFNGTRRLRSVEAYNPRTDQWHDVPSMLNPRSNFGLTVMDDRIFVVGGYNGISTCNDVESYNVVSGEWNEVCNTEIARSALSCCVVYRLPNMAQYVACRHDLQFCDEDEAEDDRFK